MKLINNKLFLFGLLILISSELLFVSALTSKKAEELATRRRHKRSHSRHRQSAPTAAPSGSSSNSTNKTLQRLSNSTYQDLNNTYTINPMNNFKNKNRVWDYKLLDKQLEEIYKDMLYVTEKNIRPLNIRAFIQNFITGFEACDTDANNVLMFSEFSACMANDTFLSKLAVPNVQPYRISSYVPYQNYTNATFFYQQIFNLLDEYKNNYLNFHDYMRLRLMVFSWKHCSVQAPFIEEVNFECALEVSSGYRSLSKTAARRLFKLGVELSNSEYQRNLDFVTFLYISLSMRLYGKINGKEDGDITRSEFNQALDNNLLPARFSQDIIDQMFNLVNQETTHNQGIDKFTFVFLDYSLRLFSVQNATRPFYINNNDFLNILSNPLFPNHTLNQIYHIPAFGMTNASYQMLQAMNLSQFYIEDDYLLKFVERRSRFLRTAPSAAPAASSGNSSNNTFNITLTGSQIFNILDINNDGWVTFQDFAHMMELIYIFDKIDVYQKGKLTIGKIIKTFKSYSEYPRISSVNRKRVRRLDMVSQDLQINVFELIVIFKIDDIVDFYVRDSDKTTLYEVDLKNILNKAGLRYIPDAYLNKCLRGNDANNIPKYDWECAITTGISVMSQFYEAAYSYTLAKNNGLNLTNTVFFNVDPQIA